MTHTKSTAILTDQKLVNEELIASIAEVAMINVQHCADLFEIPPSLAQRIRALHAGADTESPQNALMDLSTTPAPLWRLSLSSYDLMRMTCQQSPMFAPELERYRPIVARLNRLVVGMLVRYASEPVQAALVCGVTSHALLKAVQEAACISLLDCAGNAGRPLIETRLSHAMLDRFFITCDGQPVDPGMRAIVAMTSSTEHEFTVLKQEFEVHAASEGSFLAPQAATSRRTGKAPSFLLKPDDGRLVMKMLSYRVKPIDIERCMADRGIRAIQLERLQSELFPKTKDVRDVQPIWSNATRRLEATSVLLKQQALISLGLSPLQALVEAFDFHVQHHDADARLSLPRLLKEVVLPLYSREAVGFEHCQDCDAVYVSYEERMGTLDCPLCCLVYRKKLGHQRRWKNYVESRAGAQTYALAA